jgi:hypothetical protein
VRVVDDSGRPRAGIPVEWHPMEDGRVRHRSAAVRSGTDGIADFGEATALERASRGSALGIVSLEVLARDPPRMLVDLSGHRGEDIVLALPRGDRFELRVVDSDGNPSARDGTGHAVGESEEFEAYGVDVTRMRGRPCRSWFDALAVSAGHAEIPFVESGLTVEVLFRLDDRSFASSRYDFVSRASVPVAELRLPRPGPRIEGRFLVTPRSPIDVTRVDARVELISGHSGIEEKLTANVAADGRFVIETGGLVDDFNDLHLRFIDPVGSVVGLWHSSYRRSDAAPLLVGDVAIPDPFPIASGRVVDDAGSPVAGAELRIALEFGDHLPREARDQADVLHWFESKSAADGSFVALAPFEVPHCRILASADGHQRWKTEAAVKRGDENVTLVLPRLGKAAGRLLLPESVKGEAFVAGLSMTQTIDADGNENAVDRNIDPNLEVEGEVDRDGTLKFQDVEPGVHTLWVSFRSSRSQVRRDRW